MDEAALHIIAAKVVKSTDNPNKSGFLELYNTKQIIEQYEQLYRRAAQLAQEGLIQWSLFDDLSADLYIASSRYNSELRVICDTLEKTISAVDKKHVPKCRCHQEMSG